MDLILGAITLKDLILLAVFVFGLGGIWRDIREIKKTDIPEIKKTQRRHSQYLSNDHDVLIEMATQHNINHGANIRIPKMTITGNGNGP
jgi:hypothetical protein